MMVVNLMNLEEQVDLDFTLARRRGANSFGDTPANSPQQKISGALCRPRRLP